MDKTWRHFSAYTVSRHRLYSKDQAQTFLGWISHTHRLPCPPCTHEEWITHCHLPWGIPGSPQLHFRTILYRPRSPLPAATETISQLLDGCWLWVFYCDHSCGQDRIACAWELCWRNAQSRTVSMTALLEREEAGLLILHLSVLQWYSNVFHPLKTGGIFISIKYFEKQQTEY